MIWTQGCRHFCCCCSRKGATSWEKQRFSSGSFIRCCGYKKNPKLLQSFVFRNMQNFSAELHAKYLVLSGSTGWQTFTFTVWLSSESCSPLYMADRIIKSDSFLPHCPQTETEKWNWNEALRIRHLHYLVSDFTPKVSVQNSDTPGQG